MTEANLLTPEKWSNYWKSPLLTTMGAMFPDNYDGEFFDFWREQLSGSPNHVIDIACGNGALAWIAHEILSSRGETSKVTGIDLSNIDPFSSLERDPAQYPGVSFIGNCSIEQLPFNDESIDIVVSQYGIEYSDFERTISEVSRVLKPGGRMGYIIHNTHSNIYTKSTMITKEYKFVFSTYAIHERYLELDRLFGKYKSYEKALRSHRVSNKLAEIEALLPQYGAVIRRLNAAAPSQVMRNYLTALSNACSKKAFGNASSRKKAILAATEEFSDFVGRIDDLSTAALSDRQFEKLLSTIEQSGCTVQECRDIGYKELKNMGTALIAIKN
jgi:ubiquinone/menaquinone biosynthesis C-methylase UbiE